LRPSALSFEIDQQIAVFAVLISDRKARGRVAVLVDNIARLSLAF
jgi:hypothetical protein